MDGGSVDGRLLFVTFGTFVIVHPIPKMPAKKGRKNAKKKGGEGKSAENAELSRLLFMASIIPAHNGPTKESGESVCPKQTQWKTAWQRFLAGNKTKRTRVPIQPEFLQLIGAGGGAAGGSSSHFPGHNLGIFRGSKPEHRNHRSSTRTCRKRLCVFSIVAIVYTRNNRRGREFLDGLERLEVRQLRTK